MERSVVLAGFGGQGILFAGQVLAQAALRSGLRTLWIPTYGPEMRGGTAACTVIVADTEIGSPIVDRADAVIVLNPPSLAKYAGLVAPGGVLVVDSTLVEAESGRDDVTEVRVPATALALEAGDGRLVGIVALGAMLAHLEPVTTAAFRDALGVVVGAKHPEILASDIEALDSGLRAGATSSRGTPAWVPA